MLNYIQFLHSTVHFYASTLCLYDNTSPACDFHLPASSLDNWFLFRVSAQLSVSLAAFPTSHGGWLLSSVSWGTCASFCGGSVHCQFTPQIVSPSRLLASWAPSRVIRHNLVTVSWPKQRSTVLAWGRQRTCKVLCGQRMEKSGQLSNCPLEIFLGRD